jgi:hypothetical protein
MKFGVVCDVEGRTYLENGCALKGDGMDYIFYVEDIVEPRLKQIRLISDVDDAEQYFFIPPGKPNFEQHIYLKLIQELQTLESVLALGGNIKRIYWNKAIFEYYPETEAELERIKVRPAFFFAHEVPVDMPVTIPLEQLAEFVRHTSILRPLNVPMSFYREAKMEYSGQRYINCFNNSYYIIEGLFGDGKWRKDAIVEKLTKSPVFLGFAQKVFDDIAANDDIENGTTKDMLLAELKAFNQPFTVDGLITLLVETRGKLHHFSIKNTQVQGTPFNHYDFKRIALIALQLAGSSILHFMDLEIKKPVVNSVAKS